MTEPTLEQPQKLNWRFPATFWYANGAELFERAAYYGMAIALAHYLTDQIGFTDVETGYVFAAFASVLYLLPTFTGIMADRIGFRRALILAFAMLTAGYTLLGVGGIQVGDDKLLLLSEVPRKLLVLGALAIIMFGGSIIKPVISGTVAKCSDDAHRARAFSIFYAVVNIGAVLGKAVAPRLRKGFTVPWTDIRLELGLEYINYYAALMALCALVFVLFSYRNVDTKGAGKTYQEALAGLLKVLSNFRFMSLILIVAGFWAIQHQLYASMPKYIFRLLGEGYEPEWLANINPAVVVLCVLPITHLIHRWKPINSIAISLIIIPFSSLAISLSPALQSLTGSEVSILGLFALHPIAVMVIIGIALQGLAECFLSPKWLEYASKQAPEGEVGLYMGYMHLSSFFAYLFGFIISGYLLDAWCPDPRTLSAADHAQWEAALAGTAQMPAAYAHAHYIWYVFTGIGVTAFVALLVFKFVTNMIDRRRSL